ncbi:hypothetical protein [Pseudooceanicola sp. HF7]|uniref:hypothetical protein n=1 Tax=Pseudooceanicola sp. HF7 TaxID=2721560 RepID=UPI0014302218|nr:hypothetical protein [Pseudooceanicola sp. HF7]NIZ08633.1 hypothetical protein [Pseudooceanicola sp. HF7]
MTDNRDLPARLVPPGSGELGRSHWHVTELGLAVVEEMAGRGCHVATIARALGMSKDAFKSCRDRQPEVDEAYHRGLAREHDQLVSNLRAAADDGNIVANIFLLKARHQYREGEALEANLNLSVNTGGVLVVPQKQSVQDFLDGIEDQEALAKNPQKSLQT